MANEMVVNKENIEPLWKYLLIEILHLPKQTKSGILLPESGSVGLPVVGKVIRAGNESSHKEGSCILFRRFSVDELKFKDAEGEKTIYFVEDSEVIAKIHA